MMLLMKHCVDDHRVFLQNDKYGSQITTACLLTHPSSKAVNHMSSEQQFIYLPQPCGTRDIIESVNTKLSNMHDTFSHPSAYQFGEAIMYS